MNFELPQKHVRGYPDIWTEQEECWFGCEMLSWREGVSMKEANSVRSGFALFVFTERYVLRRTIFLSIILCFGLVKNRTWCYNRGKYIISLSTLLL